jgi:hypothetical protein
MFLKHPMSFCKASTVCPVAFHRTRSFPDIGCLADIRCLTVMNTVRVSKLALRLLYLVGANIYSPQQQNTISKHSYITINIA